MAYTRRDFAKLLQTGAIVAVAGFDPTAVSALTGPVISRNRVLGGEDLESLVGSEFRLWLSAGESRTLTLLAVERRSYPSRGRMTPTVECCRLRFAGEGSELLPEIRLLEHASIGKFPLFLSPGLPGRYLASLVHVPEAYMSSISIPRRELRASLPVVPSATA